MNTHSKSLRDACQSWLKTCKRNGLERSTMKAYSSHVNIHIEPRIGDLLLTGLSRSEIREFRDGLLDDGISHALAKKIMVSLSDVSANGTV